MSISPLLFWIIEIVLVLGFFMYCLYMTGIFLSGLYEVPYVSTSREAISDILERIRPAPDMKFLELGSGDGRVTCTAVKQYGVSGRGIDLNPVHILLARVRARLMGISAKAEFLNGNAWDVDLRWADIIYLFMIPEFVNAPRFLYKIEHEARSGTYIVSHWFEIERLRSTEIQKIHSGQHVTYVYRI